MAAGTSIFQLMGSIFIDSEKADKSLNKTEKNAETLGSKLGGGIKQAAKFGVALGAAAATGAAALFKVTQKAAETTDRIDKLSQKIGVSAEAFQSYEYVLSQNGIEVEVLQKTFQTLEKRMEEATLGTGKGADAFAKLNISMQKANGEAKTSEEVFDETLLAIMGMEEGLEKTRLAADLFGEKAGKELSPLLNGTADDFEKLKQQAIDMGLVLSDDQVKAGAAFQDSMDNIKRSLGAVMTNIGTELMPMFQSMMDWVMAHMPEIQAVVKKVFSAIGTFVTAAGKVFSEFLLPIFQGIYNWVKENWDTIAAIFKGVFDTIKVLWENVLSPVLTVLWNVLKGIVNFVSVVFPPIANIFKVVFGAISKTVEGVTKIFTKLADGIQKAWDWLTKWNKTDAKDKNVTTTVKTVIPTSSGIQQHAKGTDYFSGGLTWVGEQGPEIAELPKGSKIYDNKKSMAMAGQKVEHTGTIRVEGVNNKNELAGVVDIVMSELRREVRMG